LMPGTLFVVATPIGNLEDISARAIRVLGRVGIIAAEDTRRTAQLLTRYGITTPTTSFHKHNEGLKAQRLLERLKAGEDVAVVTDAGTPGLADPGGTLVAQALAASIRVEPIPGPSAVVALLSACGFSGSAFTFLGFPPTRSKDRQLWFDELRSAKHPVVFFEAPHRIVATLKELFQTVGDVRVAVGRELTKVHEELVVKPISQLLSGPVREQGEFTVGVLLGQKTEYDHVPEAMNLEAVRTNHQSDGNTGAIFDEFCRMTESGLLSRREAISVLARRHGLSQREVYAVVEKDKASKVKSVT